MPEKVRADENIWDTSTCEFGLTQTIDVIVPQLPQFPGP